jgi:tellurite resistance protein TehA-like permease
VNSGVRSFAPSNFAMVMATGIVSLAAERLGMHTIAVAMMWLNVILFAGFITLFVLRVAGEPRGVLADLTDHQKGPTFFTLVAATGILASQMLLIGALPSVAIILWLVSILLWMGSTYVIFTAFTIKQQKPELDRGITGAWLLAVVATQSVAVVSALIAPQWGQPTRMTINFFALSMWLWGGMLYIWMISLIFYRYTFFRFSPDDLTPPYWINMGAMAISTLAGDLLIVNSPDAPFLHSLLPFLKGFTVFYWATGTWWIPMLVILGIWRHVNRRFPFHYDPLYWGAVFPLGMYTVATLQLSSALELPFLEIIPDVFFVIAMVAWLATFSGFLRNLKGMFRA